MKQTKSVNHKAGDDARAKMEDVTRATERMAQRARRSQKLGSEAVFKEDDDSEHEVIPVVDFELNDEVEDTGRVAVRQKIGGGVCFPSPESIA